MLIEPISLQSFHPKKFDAHDETSFVRDSDAVNMRIELISKAQQELQKAQQEPFHRKIFRHDDEA